MITNLLNIKHPSNKIIRAFDNSRLSLRNSKNILKGFDDRKNSRVHLLIALLGLELSLNRKKIKMIMIIFYLPCFMQQLCRKSPSV